MTPRKSNTNKPKQKPGHPKVIPGVLVRTALWLTEDQRDKLQALAKKRGTTASAIMRKLIDDLPKQEGGEG